MTRPFSLYLDILRVVAAFTVLLHHFAFDRFTDGRYSFVNIHNFGFDGVIVFFVLSGLVIGFCGDEKDPSLQSFAFSRATRLFSVAVPALLFGFAADRLGSSLYPEYYNAIGYQEIALSKLLLSGLTFSNEWWIATTRLGTNGPYWSLSYEAAYYALFAITFYLTNSLKWVLALGLLLLFGPAILLLLPCWIAGWATWKVINSGWSASKGVALFMAFLPAPLFILVGLSPITGDIVLWNLAVLPDWLIDTIRERALKFEWAYFLTSILVMHLLGMHALLRNASVQSNGKLSRSVRFLAGSSFTLYLLHYPLLHILAPTVQSIQTGVVADVAILISTLAICFAIAAVFERTLGLQRRMIRSAIGRIGGAQPLPSPKPPSR